MADYGRMRASAASLIANFGSGQTVTFTRQNVSDFDPIANVETLGADTVVSVVGVIVPRAANDRSTGYDDLTAQHYVKVLVPAQGLGVFRPAPEDRLTVPGTSGAFVVTDVKTVEPDGLPIVYTVLAQKGANG